MNLVSRRLLTAALPAALVACGGGGGGGSSAPTVDPAQQAQDIAAARAFFSLLRANAAVLGGTATATTIPDGVKTFGLSMQGDALATVNAAADSTRLHQMAFSLWQDFRGGASTVAARSDAAAFADCAVYQGAFPATLGPANADFVPAMTLATGAANAAWVACSQATQALPAAGTRRHRQTWFYDMGAAVSAGAWPASVAYKAVTRSQYADAASGTVYERNLSATFAGTAGFPGGVNAGGFALRGSLPPLTDAAGALLADHYTADVTGSVAARVGGGRQIAFAGSGFGLVPLASATSGTLTVTLDNAAAVPTGVTLPSDNANVPQRLVATGTLAATVSDARGRMAGRFTEGLFVIDAAGAIRPSDIKFNGDAAIAPASGGAPVGFLSGALTLTAASTTSVTFDGSMLLPGRPQATLKTAVTATSATSDSLQGSYVQDGLTVEFTGGRGASFNSLAFSVSNGVKATVASDTQRADVTVSGRHIGVLNQSTQAVTYDDGSTQALR